MATKKDLEEGILLYKEQIDFYREQLVDAKEEKQALSLQVSKLQDALINIRAPEAYRDHLADGYDYKDPRTDEEKEHQRLVNEAEQRYIKSMEDGSMFVDGDDMVEALTAAAHRGSKQRQDISIHDNSES